MRRLAVVIALAACLIAGCGSGSRGVRASVRSAGVSATTPLPGAGKPQVTIGDKNFTEQFLLGELYRQALRAQGYAVTLNPNIGPTEVTLQALQSGRLDMYPEYLDTWNRTVAGNTARFGSLAEALRAGRSFADARGFRLLAPTRFSDTDAIGVTRAFAVENRLEQIGDLRALAASITLGAPPQFQQRPDGLAALERAYEFVPAAFKALDVGSQYEALDQGSVQAADVNTTDAPLARGAYKLLADPRHVFGFGNVVPVVSAKVLAREGPAFARTIERVDALLTTRVMRLLNAAVDISHQDPAAVARRFLRQHGLLPA